MIFAMLGTNPYDFRRLIKYLDQLTLDSGHQILIQIGNSTTRPIRCAWFTFKPRKDILEHIRTADLIICQGGFGSIIDGLMLEKPVFVVPRQQKLGECKDDQYELTQHLSSHGAIKTFNKYETLERAVQSIYSDAPIQVGPVHERPFLPINRILEEFINE